MKRSDVLDAANQLIHDERAKDYGDAHENFSVIAQMWGAYLGAKIQPHDVAHMMALLKIARLRNGPHEDSSCDGCGYLALGSELSDK